ncbi:MAG: hypothetical protein ACR2GK_05325 [Gemmatimonadaceae bacterium]
MTREVHSAALLRGTVVSAADFKANCLSLMDKVRDAGTAFIGRNPGVLVEKGDIVAPTAPDWEEGADI